MKGLASSSRRTLLFTVAASALVAACGGGGSSSGGVGGTSSGSSSSSSSSVTLPDPATAPALKTVFASKFKIGFAVDPALTSQAPTNALLLKHASTLTAESVMKANPIGVSAGVYDFTQSDALIAFAQANGISVRGHALVWHQTSPSWFFDGDRTDMTAYKALVRGRLETYVTDVVTHFKGKVYCWDVVNEVTSDSAAATYRDSEWYRIFGADFIDYAFRAARAADPGAQLFINEYLTEEAGKRGRLMTIVQGMLDRGVPVDGVGHQMHIDISYPGAAEVEAALAAVEAKGLVNHVTEMDVSVYADPGSCDANATGCLPAVTVGAAGYSAALRSQALKYRELFAVFAAHASVKSVTLWGVADNHTWLDTYPVTRKDYPLLFDTSGNPKSAFWAVVDPAFVP
ncbi:endo-1,4-beta-xylanase [Asticcacaulis sp. AC466]|uniref:endo-1,4-beta-xylanase n=1 Tax=Asticcacaulis sp. AC466 TaxID=1282362 RepID=UPI0004CE774F|nr:endo-1,4-beta-xylanase [Asticcacaulis sp. AC466]